MKGDENILEEIPENDELHAWCILEERENEQWQEVISKQSRRNLRKDAHFSLLSDESNPISNSEKITDVKQGWTRT